MEENQSLLELEVDQETGANIIEMAKWGKLFAILVASITGLMMLFFFISWRSLGVLMQSLSEMGGEGIASGYMVGIAIFLFIVIGIATVILVYLFKGVNGLKNGVQNKDQLAFNMGLANLRNSFAIYAIVTGVFVLIQLINLI